MPLSNRRLRKLAKRRMVVQKSRYRTLRTVRTRRAKVIIPRAISNQQIHKFKRYADSYQLLSPSNSAESIVPYEKVFTFNDIQSQGEFTALFDQYRITSVKIEITPNGQYITNDRTVTGSNSLNTEGTGYWVPPMLYAVIDYNDKTSLNSLAAAQEYSTLKMIPYNKKYTKFYFTPCVNMEVALDSTTTARVATRYAPWLATSSTSVEHYGMKFLVYNPNDNAITSSYPTCSWQMRVCYYFECKNVN